MSSLRDIRKRIRSVKNSQKITKAMKLVAAAKLRRAHQRLQQALRFIAASAQFTQGVVTALQASESGQTLLQQHLLWQQTPPQNILLVLLGSERGLCGGFNSGVWRLAERFRFDNQRRCDHIALMVVGRKISEYYRSRKLDTLPCDLPSILDFTYAKALAQQVVQRYREGGFNGVVVIYNQFINAITQKAKLEPLLPLRCQTLAVPRDLTVFEPSSVHMLEQVSQEQVAVLLWEMLLASACSEHGARMTAMEAASRNARELVGELTLQYNRVRQANITRELLDIVAGAEALL